MISLINPDNNIANEVLQPDGKVKLMTANEWRKYPWNDFRAFCHFHARYGMPTIELINFLKDIIKDHEGIEIGAGTGDLGHHLGIIMTDNRQQENPIIAKQYEVMQQPVIKYPPEVLEYDALDAVENLRPSVVVASWITTYAPYEMPWKSSPYGVKESAIIPLVDTFILIGNIDIHGDKPIMNHPHEEYYFDWLISRGRNQENNRIWIWRK